MSDEPQAPDEGTPDAGTAEQAPGTTDQSQQPDWQKRYEDMRSEFDRRGTRLSEVEQQAQLVTALQSDDTDVRRQAFEALGLELADETADDTQYADPTDALTQRLAALEQQLQQQNQQAAQAQQIAQIEQHVEQQLTALNGLDESDREWIVNTAVAMPPTQEGMPDIQGAFEKFTTWETERQKKWAASKRAHPFSSGGKEGTQQPDLGTRQGKVDFVLNNLRAEET